VPRLDGKYNQYVAEPDRWHGPCLGLDRMNGRRLALVSLVLISLDFGNPFVGGAFTFESSAEGLHASRHQEEIPVQAARVPDPLRVSGDRAVRPVFTLRREAPGPEHSAVTLPRCLAQSDPVPLSEDH
jgi:hypothetical protein